MYLTPPTTALMSWFLFNEPMNAMILSGIAITMAAVLLVNKS
jgi:drug/metabolite transporter (DMT)-like permease